MQTLLDPIAQKNINTWLAEDYDSHTKASLQEMLDKQDPDLNNAFYTHLEFGTGGMRGIMGIGTNRMNVYTIAKATQGLANYIKLQGIDSPSVLLGYDSRINSRLFAEIAAKTLAGNGIQVYLFDELRPTPIVSFGCRYKKCTAAVMITASHNPPEYNGYKVYWSDGAQVLPPNDEGITAEFLKIESLSQIHQADITDPLITTLTTEVDDAYRVAILPLRMFPEEMKKHGKELNILYTSLHGTGITMIPSVMKNWGFDNLHYVEKQIVVDGNFPYAQSPNPEDPSALKMGIELMLKNGNDIFIATDPDADRVGLVANHHGEAVIFNGNQVACLCLDHILKRLTATKTLPKNAAFVKTIATTELFKTICEHYHTTCFDVLTGFKYVAELIREWDVSHEFQYIFGGEESYGYLWGTHARDKDALISSLLIAEMALMAKLEGKSLVDLQEEISHKYGLHYEKLISMKFPETKEGKEKMKSSLDSLRANPPKEINGIAISIIDDYETLERVSLVSGDVETLSQRNSNVLVYWLQDGSKLMVRPSGTEPKVKLYGSVSTKDFTDATSGNAELDKKATKLLQSLENRLK